jgi:hypothetical protein
MSGPRTRAGAARRPWSCAVVGLVLLVAGCGSLVPAATNPPAASSTSSEASPPVVAAPAPPPTSYGFYAPYPRSTSSVVPAPPGFEPFYLQDVGRHGSRASVSARSVKTVHGLCTAASTSGALTALGTGFCADTGRLDAAMRRTGYGDLSPLGEEQWVQIGRRTADDHRAFFAAVAKARAPIRFVTSGVNRAEDSSDAFRRGLEAETSGLRLEKRVEDDELLRFSTPLTAAAAREIDRVEQSGATRAAAADVLGRLFGTTSTALGNARDVWDLYAIAPGMGLRLEPYLTPADAAQLAALDDAETFYRYGPGVEGNHAFGSAEALRADVLGAIRHHLDGGSTMATFRHAHAETVVPLAALLRLGPTSVPVPPGTAPDAHGWRGSQDAAMAANIDIAAYRKGSTVLVTVRANEAPVQVMGCAPSAYGPLLYELETLEACWS